jgi:8-oxo-dGTP pyrophosphatase MutT (NUDIX family)
MQKSQSGKVYSGANVFFKSAIAKAEARTKALQEAKARKEEEARKEAEALQEAEAQKEAKIRKEALDKALQTIVGHRPPPAPRVAAGGGGGGPRSRSRSPSPPRVAAGGGGGGPRSRSPPPIVQRKVTPPKSGRNCFISSKTGSNYTQKESDGIKGAGALIYTKLNGKTYILVGKEGNFLREKTGLAYNLKQEFKANTEEEAEKKIKRYARFLSKRFEFTVKYNEVIFYAKGGFKPPYTWITKFRYLRKNFQYGLPKGGIKNDETVWENAVREIREEIGVNLEDKIENVYELRDRKYKFFSIEIHPDCMGYFLRYNQSYKGELFDMKFLPLKTILTKIRNGKFNNTSDIIYDFVNDLYKNNNFEIPPELKSKASANGSPDTPGGPSVRDEKQRVYERRINEIAAGINRDSIDSTTELKSDKTPEKMFRGISALAEEPEQVFVREEPTGGAVYYLPSPFVGGERTILRFTPEEMKRMKKEEKQRLKNRITQRMDMIKNLKAAEAAGELGIADEARLRDFLEATSSQNPTGWRARASGGGGGGSR